MLDKFRFYLKQDDTHYYVGDIRTGTVTVQTTPKTITIPDGWLQSKLSWTRNMTYYGLFRALQTPFIFSNDGALILRYLYYTYGAAAVCKLQIQIRDDGGAVGLNGDWTYSDFFVGNIDFGNFKDQLKGCTAPILQGGLGDIFKANADTEYNINIKDEFEHFDLYFTGILLNAQYSFLGTSALGYWTNSSASSTNMYYLNLGSTNNPTGNYQIGIQTGQYADDTLSSTQQILTVSSKMVEQRYTFNIPILYSINNSGASQQGKIGVFARIINATGGVTSDTLLWSDSVFRSTGTTYSVIANVTLGGPNAVANPTDRIIIYVKLIPISVPVVAYTVTIYDGATFQLNALFELPRSSAPAMRYIDVYKHLTKLMTTPPGGAFPLYSGVSNFLSTNTLLTRNVDNIPYKTAITTANGIGVVSDNGTRLSIKMSDLFKDATSRWMLGLGIDSSNNLILEGLETFFDNTTQIYDLTTFGDVADFTIEPAQDLLFNIFKVGQNNETYDNVNGLDEVNTNLTFQTPLNISSVKKTLDLTSPWRRDMYGIEAQRYNIVTGGSEDSNSTSDVFVIAINDSGSPITTATPSGTVTGFNYDNTTSAKYNLELTPKRDLYRNGALLHSILDLLDTQSIQFNTGVKNINLAANLSWGNIVESDDVLISTLAAKIFRPIYFNFSMRVPLNMNSIMTTSPYGYFKFKVNGAALRGFSIDVGMTPADNGIYTFKLLCCPDVDLTPLIRSLQ